MTTDTTKPTFAELKRKARAVRSRHRKAKGAGGVPSAPSPDTPIDPLPSQNFHEKELAAPAPVLPVTQIAPQIAVKSSESEVIPLEPPASWRANGEMDVLVYCRPLNTRLLLIRTDDGHNGRVAVKPELQVRFGTGKRIWVKPTSKPGFYELVGRYTQWGSRCMD